MQVTVRSRKVEVSKDLREAVEEKVARLGRFLQGMEVAEVRFSEEKNPRIAEREVCEVTMHGHGHIVRAKAAATEPLAAVDLVVEKLEHRMEKLKGKLLGRSHPRRRKPNGASPPVDSDADLEVDQPDTPVVVKSKQFELKPMTTDEAVLQMALLGHDFFLFNSVESGGAAVVYHRSDGHIGLIEAT